MTENSTVFGLTPIKHALDDLRPDLGNWLDGKDLRLTFQVSNFLIPRLMEDDLVWTAEKVEYEFATKYRNGVSDDFLRGSVGEFLNGMVSRRLLKTPSGGGLKRFSRNAKFVMKCDGACFAAAYIYMADLAQQANFDGRVVKDILTRAQYFAEFR